MLYVLDIFLLLFRYFNLGATCHIGQVSRKKKLKAPLHKLLPIDGTDPSTDCVVTTALSSKVISCEKKKLLQKHRECPHLLKLSGIQVSLALPWFGAEGSTQC